MMVQASEGALSGRFTINWQGDQVVFSQGNLQYQASTGTWRFAEHQTDVIGESNGNVSETYSGWIDLFGWGTSGYNGHEPWLKTDQNAPYDTEGDLMGTEYDWGYHNAIQNGGNKAGMWRTMNLMEWNHLMHLRDNADNLIFPVMIDTLKCLLLLPDDWTPVEGITLRPMTEFGTWGDRNFTSDTFRFDTLTVEQGAQLEQHGAVLLPTAGVRTTTNGRMDYYYNTLRYWTGHYFSKYMGWYLTVNSTADTKSVGMYAYSNSWGFSVRLVQDYVAPKEVTEAHVDIEFPEAGAVLPPSTDQEWAGVAGVCTKGEPLFNTIGHVSVPDTAGYEVTQYICLNSAHWYMPGDTVLQPHAAYSMMVFIAPTEGNTFPLAANGSVDKDRLTVTANGQPVDLQVATDLVFFIVDFTTDGPVITDVEITAEWPEPETVMPMNSSLEYMSYVFKKDDPLFNTIGRISVPDTAGYEIGQYAYYTSELGYLPGESVLQYDSAYYVIINIPQKEGYVYLTNESGNADAANIGVTVNGDRDVIIAGSEGFITVGYLFRTRKEEGMGIDEVESQESRVKSQKRIVNGQLLIERDGRVYNVLGAEIH
jgi:hypothetical protein